LSLSLLAWSHKSLAFSLKQLVCRWFDFYRFLVLFLLDILLFQYVVSFFREVSLLVLVQNIACGGRSIIPVRNKSVRIFSLFRAIWSCFFCAVVGLALEPLEMTDEFISNYLFVF